MNGRCGDTGADASAAAVEADAAGRECDVDVGREAPCVAAGASGAPSVSGAPITCDVSCRCRSTRERRCVGGGATDAGVSRRPLDDDGAPERSVAEWWWIATVAPGGGSSDDPAVCALVGM